MHQGSPDQQRDNPKMNERLEKILKIVQASAKAQATAECLENYLRSCEAHSGDTAEAAKIVRGEMEEEKQRRIQVGGALIAAERGAYERSRRKLFDKK